MAIKHEHDPVPSIAFRRERVRAVNEIIRKISSAIPFSNDVVRAEGIFYDRKNQSIRKKELSQQQTPFKDQLLAKVISSQEDIPFANMPRFSIACFFDERLKKYSNRSISKFFHIADLSYVPAEETPIYRAFTIDEEELKIKQLDLSPRLLSEVLPLMEEGVARMLGKVSFNKVESVNELEDLMMISRIEEIIACESASIHDASVQYVLENIGLLLFNPMKHNEQETTSASAFDELLVAAQMINKEVNS